MNAITTSNSRIFIAAAVAAVCFAAASGARADGAVTDVPTIKVKYSHSSLDTQAGAATLYQRIRHAAQRVCGDPDPLRLDQVAAAKPCIDHAIFSSVWAVGNPKLISEYNAHVSVGQQQINLADVR